MTLKYIILLFWVMMEVVSHHSSNLFANGNVRGGMADHMASKDAALLNTPEVTKVLKEEQDYLTRELQFYDIVSHVLEKIENETQDEFAEDEKDLWPEVSLLDMKLYLKSKVYTSNVSENSPIFVLDAVSTKLGRLLHTADIYDIRQLAACSDAEIDDIVAHMKSAQRSDIEFAVQDARDVLRILVTEKARQKGAWDNLSTFAELNLKENTQKIAKFVWQLNPKGIVEALARPQSVDEEDIDAFQTI